jgi:hypothetical protein
MSDTPRTDTETWRDEMDHVDTDYTFAQSVTVSADFARQLERELADMTKQRDELAARFTRLDEPRYSGKPMLDLVLSVRNPEFDAWVASLPPTYWARYDLSAVRIGWEAAKTAGKTSSHEP